MFLRLIRSYRSAEITDPFLTVNNFFFKEMQTWFKRNTT